MPDFYKTGYTKNPKKFTKDFSKLNSGISNFYSGYKTMNDENKKQGQNIHKPLTVNTAQSIIEALRQSIDNMADASRSCLANFNHATSQDTTNKKLVLDEPEYVAADGAALDDTRDVVENAKTIKEDINTAIKNSVPGKKDALDGLDNIVQAAEDIHKDVKLEEKLSDVTTETIPDGEYYLNSDTKRIDTEDAEKRIKRMRGINKVPITYDIGADGLMHVTYATGAS